MTSTHDRPILQNLTHTTKNWRLWTDTSLMVELLPAGGEKEVAVRSRSLAAVRGRE